MSKEKSKQAEEKNTKEKSPLEKLEERMLAKGFKKNKPDPTKALAIFKR